MLATPRRKKILGGAALSACLCLCAFGHEGYITTYNHHVEKGKLGLMLFNDYTSPSKHKRDGGQGDYFSQMAELSYAPTSQLILEFMVEGFEDVDNGSGQFTGARYEARYRLFEEEVPLNPMLYAEYEDLDTDTRFKMETSGWVDPPYTVDEGEGEPNREKILETRLILSKDVGRWNYAFNWINESDLVTGETAFGYSAGTRYTWHDPMARKAESEEHPHNRKWLQPAALGVELFGALGDERKFGLRPSRQEHYLQPSITCHLGEDWMATLGFAHGLSGASDDMVRLTFGRTF